MPQGDLLAQVVEQQIYSVGHGFESHSILFFYFYNKEDL